jgi:hypothetical protein
MLASHEVETPPTPPKPIYMVSGVMMVKGYSIPAFLKNDEEKQVDSRGVTTTMSLLSIVQETSVKYSEPSCNVYG